MFALLTMEDTAMPLLSALTRPTISMQGSPAVFVFCKGLGDTEMSMSLERLSEEVHRVVMKELPCMCRAIQGGD